MKTRSYNKKPGITNDYYKVRNFLIKLGYCEFVYARWDWMITHSYLDQDKLDLIRIWEDNDEVVAIVTYDTVFETAYCLNLREYDSLKNEMIQYVEDNYDVNGLIKIVIPIKDTDYQKVAYLHGFRATNKSEYDAVFYKEMINLEYTLPEGYRIISMSEDFNPYKYLNCLWKGFNHELNGEGTFTFNESLNQQANFEMFRDNVDLSLKLAVVNSEGHYVAYCGLWYDDKIDFGLIEPLATIPECRKLGLGRALVYEGVKRVFDQGAKKVFVGSNQNFYYSIGMFPFQTHTIWEKKK